MLFILSGFIDAHSTQFNEFEDLAEMWIHEVVHSVLDRFSDQNQKQFLFKHVKIIASEAFKIREKGILQLYDQVLFCYGCPESKNIYRRLPDQETIL